MTKINILSKPEFNEFMSNHKIDDSNIGDFSFAAISINDTHGQWAVSWFNEDHPNLLRLWFDDVEHDEEVSPTNKISCKAFSADQAKAVFEFVNANKDKNFIVHCAAGISRSGAVGSFILDYLEGDREYFEKYNKHILPNPRVRRMLNRRAWER